MSFIDDAVREYVFNVGRERPEQAWILSPYDSWHQNPFYKGPAQPHPEDDTSMYEGLEELDVELELDMEFAEDADTFAPAQPADPFDDDIPF